MNDNMQFRQKIHLVSTLFDSVSSSDDSVLESFVSN